MASIRCRWATSRRRRAAIGPETAAILIEPVQGEGGVRHAGWAFLRALRDLADEHGLLLILDEVQTGMGRTGKLFAYEWAGIEPDIMAIAKGLGGGFPVGAFLATDEAAAGMTAGTHGSTFGGNPLAMAAGNAVLDVVLEEGFLASVRQKALLLKQRLAEITDRHGAMIEEVRGEGLLIGLKCRMPVGQADRGAVPQSYAEHRRGRQCRPAAAAAHRQRGRNRRGLREDLRCLHHPRK